MALYDVNVGDTPLASDVNQLIDVFNGKNDIGPITFAPQIDPPSVAISNVTTATGLALGVGAYQYAFTYITGYVKSNGVMVVQGETPPSPSISVTTIFGSTNVVLGTIPVGSGASIIGRRIYRTKVGGSTFYLLATIDNVVANYTDSTADASLGTGTPPINNTTGTRISSIDSVTRTLGNGLNVITTDQETTVQPKFYGRTLVNLLGKDGNFELDADNNGVGDGWAKTGSGTFSIDSSTYKYGSKSQKISASTGNNFISRSTTYTANAYYLLLADVYTTGATSKTYMDYNGGNSAIYPSVSNEWCTLFQKFQGDGSAHTLLVNIVDSGTLNIDGVRIYQIDQATYNKIGDGVSVGYQTGSDLAIKFPYVDSIKHVNGAYLSSPGKNLLPPFTSGQWTLASTAKALNPYSLELDATATYQNSYVNIDIEPSQTYTLSGNWNGYVEVIVKDANGTVLSDVGSVTSPHTFSTPATAKTVQILLSDSSTGTFTFTNLQLEVGSVATGFTPQNESHVYIETKLASSVDGSIQDTAYERDGTWYKNANFKMMDLDGTLPWSFISDYAGYKLVTIPLSPQPLNIYGTSLNGLMIAKYDGSILSNYHNGTENNSGDKSTTDSNNLYVSIADTDSGWGDSSQSNTFSGNGTTTAFTLTPPSGTSVLSSSVTATVGGVATTAFTISGNTVTFTTAPASGTNNVVISYTACYNPTAAEIQAYFYGWKMKTSGQQAGSGSYTGTGTKSWCEIAKAINSPTDTTDTTTLPTTDGYSWDTYTIDPYKLTYQLASAQETSIMTEGELTLINGGNQVTVGEGVIVREVANPTFSSAYSTYYINYRDGADSNIPSGNQLKYQTDKIIDVYKNGVIDTKWSINTNSYAYGDQYAQINSSDYDPTAVYTVTYLAQTYQLTSNELQVDVTYETSLGAVVQQNTADIQALTETMSTIQNDYASKNHQPWVGMTLQNGWVASSQDESPGYMKDSLGFVHLKGIITGGTQAIDTVIFTLPVGFRPVYPYIHAPNLSNNGTTWGPAQLRIFNNGDVHIDAITGNSLLNLNITPFLAEQ